VGSAIVEVLQLGAWSLPILTDLDPYIALNTPRRVAPAPPSTLKPAFPDPGDRQDPDPENVPGSHPKAHGA